MTKNTRTVFENKQILLKKTEELIEQLEELKKSRDLNSKEVKFLEALEVIKKLLIQF